MLLDLIAECEDLHQLDRVESMEEVKLPLLLEMVALLVVHMGFLVVSYLLVKGS